MEVEFINFSQEDVNLGISLDRMNFSTLCTTTFREEWSNCVRSELLPNRLVDAVVLEFADISVIGVAAVEEVAVLEMSEVVVAGERETSTLLS